MTSALIAQCTACPFLAAAATDDELAPLMDEHTTKAGHLFTVSRQTHSRRTL